MNVKIFDEFRECCVQRWPDVEVLIGPPQHRDNSGELYQEVCIGGVLLEGEVWPMVSRYSGCSDYNKEQWWLSFEKFVGPDPKTIVVRRLPTVSTWDILRLETFDVKDPDVPEFRKETRSQISGRFSVYY